MEESPEFQAFIEGFVICLVGSVHNPAMVPEKNTGHKYVLKMSITLLFVCMWEHIQTSRVDQNTTSGRVIPLLAMPKIP